VRCCRDAGTAGRLCMMASATSPVDFHNHVMPGVDDGASDEVQATAALRAFVEQGILDITATPHVDGSLTAHPRELEQRLAELDVGWATLQALAAEHFPEVTVRRGAEIMLDTPQPDLSDPRLRLDGGTFALVEYPFMMVPPNSGGVIRCLLAAGVTPVIAHPERYGGIAPGSTLPVDWRRQGALLQVNAGSITGRYGPQARDNALDLLERGLVHYICSDYHCRSRPSTAGARRMLTELGGAEHADLLTAVNTRRLIEGQEPLPVPPLRIRTSMMNRLKKWLR
jgi:protein-tyrosine phosphatase